MCSLAIVIRTQDLWGSFSIDAVFVDGRETVYAPPSPTFPSKHSALIFSSWIDVKHLM